MQEFDEPILGSSGKPPAGMSRRSIQDSIRELVAQQPFAVLCTQGAGQPYGSLVAYAISDALDTAVFATSRATRKYSLLIDCERVALVVDSRSAYPGELMKVEAITATGRARELEAEERESWAKRLILRHPQLKVFVESPSTAVFGITMTRYLYVTRFQEVHQWVPDETGTDGAGQPELPGGPGAAPVANG